MEKLLNEMKDLEKRMKDIEKEIKVRKKYEKILRYIGETLDSKESLERIIKKAPTDNLLVLINTIENVAKETLEKKSV